MASKDSSYYLNKGGVNHRDIIVNILLSFQRQGLFCDTILVAAKEQRLYAHSAVLAAVSPHFRTTLNAKPHSDIQPNIVDFTNYGVNVIRKLTEFFYTGRLERSEDKGDLDELLSFLKVSINIDTCDSENGSVCEDNTEVVSEAVDLECCIKLCRIDSYKQELIPDPSAHLSHDDIKLSNNIPVISDVKSAKISAGKNLKRLRSSNSDEETSRRSIDNDSLDESSIGEVQGKREKTESDTETENPESESQWLQYHTSEGGVYACKLCTKIFKLPSSLHRHLAWHADPQSDVSLNKSKTLCTKKKYIKKPRGVYKCKFCLKTFKIATGLERHLAHHADDELELPKVSVNFAKTQKKLYKYLKKPRGVFPCKLCSKKFKIPSGLDRHIASHHPFSGIIADTLNVDKASKEGQNLESEHIENSDHQNELSFSPIVLPEIAFNESDDDNGDEDSCDMASDVNNSQEMIPVNSSVHIKCEFCSETFTSGSSFDAHQWMHYRTSEGVYACKMCDQTFELATELNQHLASHTENQPDALVSSSDTQGFDTASDKAENAGTQEKPKRSHRKSMNLKAPLTEKQLRKKRYKRPTSTTCEFCNETFKSHHTYQIHRWIHYRTPDGMFTCKLCPKSYKAANVLRGHIYTIHSGIHKGAPNRQLHVCHLCGREFNDRTKFDAHMAAHYNLNAHKCEICGKGFNTLNAVKRHQIVHTEERNFCCKECGKTFRWYSTLYQHHSAVHLEEKRYECAVCHKRFPHSTKLKCHMRTHTGEKPYPCSVCSRAFSNPTHRDYHVKSKHMENVEKAFACQYCGTKFATLPYLIQHEKRHKGVSGMLVRKPRRGWKKKKRINRAPPSFVDCEEDHSFDLVNL